MGSEEFVKKVYVNELEDSNSRGILLGRWRDRLKEYMYKRSDIRGGRLQQTRRDYLDKERWSSSSVATP